MGRGRVVLLHCPLPASLQRFFTELKDDFEVVVVGGFVRDYLLTQTLSQDVDLELYREGLTELDLSTSPLAATYSFQKTAYQVWTLELGGFEIQLTLPRREVFPQQQSYAHSDVEAFHDGGLSFAEASRRRDFTINAMGLRFVGDEGLELLDPHGGERDLAHKLLRPLDHFAKDPVRLLRAVRFRLNLDFNYTPELVAELKGMDVSQLSLFYLLEEAQKCRHSKAYFKELLQWGQGLPELLRWLVEFMVRHQLSWCGRWGFALQYYRLEGEWPAAPRRQALGLSSKTCRRISGVLQRPRADWRAQVMALTGLSQIELQAAWPGEQKLPPPQGP